MLNLILLFLGFSAVYFWKQPKSNLNGLPHLLILFSVKKVIIVKYDFKRSLAKTVAAIVWNVEKAKLKPSVVSQVR